MPTYEYQCTECEHRFEVIQRVSDEPIKVCERCGAPVRKILFPVGIMFKGSGFHVNDYPRSGSNGGNGSKKSAASVKDTEKTASTS